jgi:hypothetical protein
LTSAADPHLAARILKNSDLDPVTCEKFKEKCFASPSAWE